MSITYPLTLPATPGPARVTLRGSNVVGVSTSPFTLQQQIQRHQGQAWGADIELPPLMGADEAEPWIAFLLSLRGRTGTFLLGDPARRSPRGAATGEPVVDGSGQEGEQLLTSGWAPDTAAVLRAGDYIQLGTGLISRLYKVLADVDSDADGNATLDIWPRLRESPGNGSPIITDSPVGLFRLDSNVAEWDWQPPTMAGIRFSAREAI